jgi:integrase
VRRQGSIVAKCSKGHRRADGRCSSRCTRYYVVVEGPKTADGRRRRLWSSSFATKRAAEEALTAELSRRHRGIVLNPQQLTVAEYVERWLAHVATIREPSTVHRYGELLRGHVCPMLGHLQLKVLTPLHVQQCYDQLAIDGRRDGKGPLGSRTIGHVHRALHRALRQAVRWQLVGRNAAADVESPSVPKSDMVTLTPEQARQLLEHAEGWLHTLVLLGAATGARRGELLALRWSDVDLDAGTIRIARSAVLVGDRVHWKAPKNGESRTVVLGPSVVAELRRHRTAQAERRLESGPAYHADEDLVVAKIKGGAVRPDYASQAFRNLVRRVGLPESIHVHTLRHSAASFLAAAGVPPSDIAAQLGHKDGGRLALRTYVHVFDEGLARAGAHLDSVLAGGQ